MIRNLLKQLDKDTPWVGVDELQLINDQIEEKQRKIAEEKSKIREEHSDGARLTRYRFTV